MTIRNRLGDDYQKAILLIEQLSAKIKELEEELNTLQNHANNMGEIISNQTKIRIGLEGELTVANEHIKQLEGERDGFRNGQLQLQNMVSDLMDVNAKWANKVKELSLANQDLNQCIKELKKEIEFHIINNQSWVEECKKSNVRVKELVEGIERHREHVETIEEHMYQSKEMARMMQSVNEELYKLIEKEKR